MGLLFLFSKPFSNVLECVSEFIVPGVHWAFWSFIVKHISSNLGILALFWQIFFLPSLFFHWGLHDVQADPGDSVPCVFGQFPFSFHLLKDLFVFIVCAWAFASMYIYTSCLCLVPSVWCVYRPEKGIKPPGSLVTDVSEWTCRGWEQT